MSSIQAFFRYLTSGIVSSLILALAFIVITGIKNARRDDFWNREEKIAKMEAELSKIGQNTRELYRRKRMEEAKEKSLWVPLESLKSTVAEFSLELKLMKERGDFNRKKMEILACKSQTIWDYFTQSFKENFFRYLLYAALLVFLFPVLWKIFMYYFVAALIERFPPVAADRKGCRESIESAEADVTLDYVFSGDEKLYLRAGNWGKKRSNVKARTKIMWNAAYPLVSLAADLLELVELSSLEGKTGKVSITSPDPDMFVGKIRLKGDGGLVIRPRYLVAVTDGIKIRTRWSFNFHNIVSCRIRQIIVYGTGTVFITGSWGVDFVRNDPSEDSRIEDNLALGYEAAAEYSLCRTETFWHYFRGSATLFDLRLRKGGFLTQNNNPYRKPGEETFFERTLGAVLSGIGSFLGF